MPRGTKRRKTPTLTRAIVADNVKALMDVIYAESANKPRVLANDSGVALSTIQRILAREVGASVDSLEGIARALGCSVTDLVTASEGIARALGLSRNDAHAREPIQQRKAT